MPSWRDFIVFLAGFECFHAVSHAMLFYTTLLPLDLGFMVLTPMMNGVATAINGVITLLLLGYASKLSKK